MKKIMFMMVLMVLVFAISMQSASAIFLGGEEWFGRPVTRGSMYSSDDYMTQMMGQRSTNTYTGSNSNDYMNQYLAGQYSDMQNFNDASVSQGNSESVTGGVGDGTRLTRKLVWDHVLKLPGHNNKVHETTTLSEYGGEFANYNTNSYNTQNQRSTQNNRNIVGNFQNQQNSGSSAQAQTSYDDSINAMFGEHASRGFSINLNRFL